MMAAVKRFATGGRTHGLQAHGKDMPPATCKIVKLLLPYNSQQGAPRYQLKDVRSVWDRSLFCLKAFWQLKHAHI